MFETWAATIGGILGVARIPGFLGNLDEFYAESDAEVHAWRSFILNWWERFGAKEVRVSELWEAIKDDTTLPISGDTEQAQKIRLGKLLADKRDRVFSVEIQGQNRQLRVERGGQRQRAYEWRLSECGESGELIPHGPRARAHTHTHACTRGTLRKTLTLTHHTHHRPTASTSTWPRPQHTTDTSTGNVAIAGSGCHAKKRRRPQQNDHDPQRTRNGGDPVRHEAGMPWAGSPAHSVATAVTGGRARHDGPRRHDRLVGKLIGLVAAG